MGTKPTLRVRAPALTLSLMQYACLAKLQKSNCSKTQDQPQVAPITTIHDQVQISDTQINPQDNDKISAIARESRKRHHSHKKKHKKHVSSSSYTFYSRTRSKHHKRRYQSRSPSRSRHRRFKNKRQYRKCFQYAIQ